MRLTLITPACDWQVSLERVKVLPRYWGLNVAGAGRVPAAGMTETMLTRRTFAAGFAAGGLLSAARAEPRPQTVRAVLELFTSQGCSSCPAADKLFVKLSKDPDVITLSMPVTIWDYLGWKDTLAQHQFTVRQRHYGIVRGDRHVYTPQAVVNGVAHAVGSDFHAIEAARKASQEAPGVLALAVGLVQAGTGWKAEIAAGSGSGCVFLARYERHRTVEIGRGENTGRKLTYTNVVRDFVRLADYSGAALSLDLPADLRNSPGEGFALLVQAGTERRPGAILGAAESPREIATQ